MKKVLVLLILVLVAGGLVFAGGATQQQTPAESQSDASLESSIAPGLTVINHARGDWEAGKKGGRMVIGQLGEGPKTFNPVLAEETSTTDLTERLQSQIGRRNQFTMEYEPWLAESWTVSADEKTVTIRLRANLRWSDGTPLTSRDFVDGFNKIIYDEGIQTSSRDAFTVGGELIKWTYIDDRTFTMSAVEVYAGLNGSLLETSPLPMHIFGPIYDSQGADGINTLWGIDSDPSVIPSSGPWVIKSHVAGQRTIFGPNPNYHERDAAGIQLPYLDEVVFVYTPDQDTLLQNFIAGQSDWLVVRGADYASLVGERDRLGFKIYEVGEATSTNFITFNQNPIDGPDDLGLEDPVLSQLSNKQFRTALAHLIDRETIINNLEFGFGYPQYTFIPRSSPFYWDDVEDIVPHYDPIRAAEILDEIGYLDRDGDGFREDDKGNRIDLIIETNAGNRIRETIATLFAQEAQNVGIRITMRAIDFNVLVGKLTTTYDWHLILIGLTGSLDPISGSNVYPSYGNLHMIEPNQTSPRRDWEKGVDAAWEEANNTTNQDQRKSGYQKIQQLWAEELPWAYTYTPLVMEAYSSRFGNVYPQPTENYDWEGVLHRLYVK